MEADASGTAIDVINHMQMHKSRSAYIELDHIHHTPYFPSQNIMPNESRTSRSVRCNCGKVALVVTGIDKLAVHCYCINCQRTTGSAFAHNHRFSEAEIEFERGEELVKQYADRNTDSGRAMFRHFCSNCVSFYDCGSDCFSTAPLA